MDLEVPESNIKMYTVKDLQEILHVGKNVAYKIVKLKGFPTIQIGRKILIPPEEFHKWIHENIKSHINI